MPKFPTWREIGCSLCGDPINARSDIASITCAEIGAECGDHMAAKRQKTKNGKTGEMVERGRFGQLLPVKIDPQTIETKSRELARVIREREVMLARKREDNANYREKLNFFDERLTELADSVTAGTQRQTVQCIEYLMADNSIRVIREDTGEIVETRTASAKDLQEPLPLEKKKREGKEVEETDDVE